MVEVKKKLSLIKRWLIFINERFELISHLIMIFSFFLASLAIVQISSNLQIIQILNYKRISLSFLLIFLIFFHMRLFDDIKDYETDKLFNKERPLPRGVLTLTEYGFGTLICIIIELLIAILLGFKTFTTYSIVLCFTLLMRQEFFIGNWLRPKLELYAITHTFSATLLGFLIFSSITNSFILDIPIAFIYFAIGNWFVFNVFEFGRKTFSKSEERDGVDSYSSRLTPFGAFTLLAINIFLAFTMLYYSINAVNNNLQSNLILILFLNAIISFFVISAGMVYSIKPSNFNAKFYRNSVTFYLIVYHLVIGGVWIYNVLKL